MRKKGKISVKTLLFWGLSLATTAVCTVGAFFLSPQKTEQEPPIVLRLWHVDCFEGGKGSRASFLKGVANKFKEQTGVIVTVSSLTQAGAETAFEKGSVPDLFSFGVGISCAVRYATVLKGLDSQVFVGGEERVAIWCKGGYAIYSKTEDFTLQTSENTVLSVGGNHLPQVAYARSGGKECAALPSTTAYVKFLSGEYRYLFGTQRDLYRFATRGETVYVKPIFEYCDLYQYVSVTAKEETERRAAMEFTRYLLSEQVQKNLVEIGMLSAVRRVYESGNPQSKFENGSVEYALPPFIGAEGLRGVKEAAQTVLRGGGDDELKKFLKRL